MTGYDYGNARLRAMRSRLVGSAFFDRWRDATVSDLIAALLDTDYRVDLDRAALRHHGRRQVDEALRQNTARNLNRIRSFYEGAMQLGWDRLLSRWELHNLVAVLRGQASRRSADEILAALTPVGRLDDAALTELAEASGLRDTIDKMVIWGLPDLSTALALVDVFPQYERTENLALLEHRLIWLQGEARRKVLAAGVPREVAVALGAFVDFDNLQIAARLWEAEGRGEMASIAEHRLPGFGGGAIAVDAIEAMLAARRPEDAVRAVLVDRESHWVAGPLRAWAQAPDAARLERAMRRALTLWALHHFSTGDPLGAAVPVAYLFAKDNEVRNLRLLTVAAGRRLPADVVASHMIH
jgi:V/A-type H+-transporting ATPase subunit C